MNILSLLDSGRGSRLDTLVEDNLRLRRPLALARRISFCALTDATLCSAVTLGIAQVFASRRAAPLLLVDSAGPTQSLRRLAGIVDEQWDAQDIDDPAREHPLRLAEAVSGLPQLGEQMWLLDVAHVRRLTDQPTVDEWSGSTEKLSRFPDVVASDLGRRDPSEAVDIAARSHSTCVVSSVDREEIDAAASVVRLIRRKGRDAHLCVVGARPPRSGIRLACRDLAPGPIIVGLSGSPSATWSRTNQAQLIRLAADLIGEPRVSRSNS